MALVNETLVLETIEVTDNYGEAQTTSVIETIEADDKYDESQTTSALEVLEISDSAASIIYEPTVIDNTLELTDRITDEVSTRVIETLTVTDIVTPSTSFIEDVRDTLIATDYYSKLQSQVVIDTLEVTDSVSDEVYERVIDVLEVTDRIAQHITANEAVLESIEVDDYASTKIIELTVVDTVTLEDSAIDDTLFADRVVESLVVLDFVSQALESPSDADRVIETITVSDYSTYAGGSYSDIVIEELEATDWIYSRDYGSMAWVMNTETGAPSFYDNFEFSSIVEHNGVLIAAGREGLYFMEAAVDDTGRQIPGEIKSGLLDWQTDQRKRLRDVYVGYTGAQLELTVEAYNQADRNYSYEMVEREADAPRNNRIRVGRGLNSRYWRFTITNPQGGAFQVFDMTANVDVSNRRL